MKNKEGRTMYFLHITGTGNDDFFNLKILNEVYYNKYEAEEQKELSAMLLQVDEEQIEIVEM
jgi:hypothetical protein